MVLAMVLLENAEDATAMAATGVHGYIFNQPKQLFLQQLILRARCVWDAASQLAVAAAAAPAVMAHSCKSILANIMALEWTTTSVATVSIKAMQLLHVPVLLLLWFSFVLFFFGLFACVLLFSC